MSNKPARFDSFLKRAESLIKRPARVQKLTGQAVRKLANQGAGGVRDARSQLQTAIAMLNDWRTGAYSGLSKKTLVSLAAALLYFVVPLDVIPDFLLGWGYIDDIAVVSYVFSQLSEEIAAYKAWSSQQPDEQLEHEP